MTPDEQNVGYPHAAGNESVADDSIQDDIAEVIPTGDTGWRLWPPSPKMQIAMIALGFGLFNLILIAIWAVVMVYRF